MARIINGVAIADDYEAIVGPIEGYTRPDHVDAEDFGTRKPVVKGRAGRHVNAETKVVTEVDG